MIYKKEFTVIAPESTLKIDAEYYPVEIDQGSDWTCKGTISSNYNITVVNCFIFRLNDGKEEHIYKKW